MNLDLAAIDRLLERMRVRIRALGSSSYCGLQTCDLCGDPMEHVARADLVALLELAAIARMVAPNEVLAVVGGPLRREGM